MTPSRTKVQRLSRRKLLKTLGGASLLLRSPTLRGLLNPAISTATPKELPDFPFYELRYTPHYPASSPLEEVLRLVAPGSDEYVTEFYAAQIEEVLQRWAESLQAGQLSALQSSLGSPLQASSWSPSREQTLRTGSGVDSFRRTFPEPASITHDRFLLDFQDWLGRGTQVASAAFKAISTEVVTDVPARIRSRIRYSIVVAPRTDDRTGDREQRTGFWFVDWSRPSLADTAAPWRVLRWESEEETRAVVHGRGFVDITEQALGGTPSYRAQMQQGADYWRGVLDAACGIDVYGNNGVAAGDFDNDGLDDLYICQPAGLPNRLYQNRGDGTFEDVTERAGVGVLDNTACALFADFRNVGLQDLLVVCGSGPLLFVNQGDGKFKVKSDAFRFARTPEGTFTHAALADYDRDGRLDIYLCVYSYYLGLDQYHYPVPYYDARNGPPNFLLHNEGDGTFTDRTEVAGLNAENDRYSFACAWGESTSAGLPDLYVVNDFGRNNLYINNGDGTFRPVSSKAHVEDVGAGMSACWADYNNDGRPDLYVANMWSAAGQRISHGKLFHPNAPEKVRELYQRHAQGNALYANKGSNSFESAGRQADVEVGGWAWGSDFWDFDHDGYVDLYVTNGYITAPEQEQARSLTPRTGNNNGKSGHAAPTDLASFFWRQVVGKSTEDATPTLAYERGWNALNELIRSDHSWAGAERNVLLANNRDGTFSEISGATGLDLIEDGRAFALADIDRDGRLEVVVKNRNGPQLRILHNAMTEIGDSIVFRLRGTQSNRDAIGAAVTLFVGALQQTRYLQAGSGFLTQHTKELHFGLGKQIERLRASVRWPNGSVQEFDPLPRNSRIMLTEGSAAFTVEAFAPSPATHTHAVPAPPEPPPPQIETWLVDPLKAPIFSAPDLAANMHKLQDMQGEFAALFFWSALAPQMADELNAFEQHRVELAKAHLGVLAVNVDKVSERDPARTVVEQQRPSYPVVFADEEVAGIYNLIYRFLFDRRKDLPIPCTFLLDRRGLIVKVYQGPVACEHLLEDVRCIPATPAERVERALPFTGKRYHGAFSRNEFTYGVAMFQHGYLQQAVESFQQVIATKPNDAEGLYNLGTLNLRMNKFSQAREYLQRTVELKPDYPEAWNNLGMMAAQESHTEQAIKNFQQSLHLRPNYPTALLNLGNVYRRQRAFPEAQELLLHALSLQPDDPETNYSLGLLSAQQNQVKPASDYLRRAVELRPNYPEALNNLGVLYVRNQEYDKAEKQFTTCIKLAPSFEDSYMNLARLYQLQHEREKAVSVLQELLQVHPESAAGKQGLQALEAMP